jgi:hypothetical protein
LVFSQLLRPDGSSTIGNHTITIAAEIGGFCGSESSS